MKKFIESALVNIRRKKLPTAENIPGECVEEEAQGARASAFRLLRRGR